MVVPSTKFKLENTPSVFFLDGAKLQYVDSYKYLGMFIHVHNDDLDVVRQLKCVILRTNILMRTFSPCSVEVKLFLFKSYCSHLWYNFTKVQLNKLRITYNNIWGACLIYILDAAPVKCLRTVIFVLWMRREGHVYSTTEMF